MKGQYLPIQWSMYFGIGVAMVIYSYFLFSGISDTIKNTSASTLLNRVDNLIGSTAIVVYEEANRTNISARHSFMEYNLTIPEKLSDCIYAIEIKAYIEVYCTGNPGKKALFSMQGINMKGSSIIYSTRGYVTIRSDALGVEFA